MSKKSYIYIGIAIVAIILIGAGSYYYISQNKTPATASNNQNNNSNAVQTPNNRNRSAMNFTSVSGKISSIDGNTVILDLDNNQGQKIINLSSQTQITKLDNSSKEELIKADQIISIETEKKDSDTIAKIVTQRNLPNAPQNQPNPNPQGNPNRQNNPNPNNTSGNPTGNRQRPTNSNLIFGKIQNIDGDKITIASQSPSQDINAHNSTVVLLNDKTTYKKQNKLQTSDLKTDQKVNISGTTDTTGSLAARNVNVE